MTYITSVSSTKLPEGFVVAPPTMADLPAAVELFNRCAVEMDQPPAFATHDIDTEWRTPGFDLDSDVRVVTSPEGRMVGYIEVWLTGELPVHPWVWGRVDPEYRNLGIGTFLQQWAEQRAMNALERVPDGIRVSIQSGSDSGHEPTRRLLERCGMQLIRHNWSMVMKLDEAPPTPEWPAAVGVRSFTGEGDQALQIYRAFREAWRDHFGFVEEPEESGFARWSHFTIDDPDFDPSLWILAYEGDEIAGFSLCRSKSYDDPSMGYVSILGVRRPWRRKGLGIALLHQSFQEFWKRGYPGVTLGVDASSLTGATRLYERAGMRVMRQFDLYEKELRAGRELAAGHADIDEESNNHSLAEQGESKSIP